jgi:NAD(P)-dependent dehydrogenase (short-subunit alcohol dehydrogenase family)
MWSTPSLAGRRVVITGAARSIGALLAERLHARGAKVALLGLEPDLLAGVADRCGGAPWLECDIADRHQVDESVEELVGRLGGLDVVVANAGIAAQLPIVGGDPAVMERTIQVNTLGTYYTLRAAGAHVSHPGGYALAVSSMAAAVHLPLLSAYSASKAAVEAIGNTLRIELQPSGARVGVAYFAELDTDMTHRGFGTEAAKAMLGSGTFTRTTPVRHAIDAVERGIARRSRRIVVPRMVAPGVPARMLVQPVVDRVAQRNLRKALDIARHEEVGFTTTQPEEREPAR